jgi:hypothetical protein
MISNLETLVIQDEAWFSRIGLTSARISTMLHWSPKLQVSLDRVSAS